MKSATPTTSRSGDSSTAAKDTLRTTISGVENKIVYKPADTANFDYSRDLGNPGEFPFTRGIHETMYRGPTLDHAPVRGLRHGERNESCAL